MQGTHAEASIPKPVPQGVESSNKMIFDLNEVPQEETDMVEDSEQHHLLTVPDQPARCFPIGLAEGCDHPLVLNQTMLSLTPYSFPQPAATLQKTGEARARSIQSGYVDGGVPSTTNRPMILSLNPYLHAAPSGDAVGGIPSTSVHPMMQSLNPHLLAAPPLRVGVDGGPSGMIPKPRNEEVGSQQGRGEPRGEWGTFITLSQDQEGLPVSRSGRGSPKRKAQGQL